LKRIIALLATLATAVSLSFLAAGAAGASVSPVPVITSNGEAGYYAGTNTPAPFVQVRSQFYLRVAAEGLGAGGGEGVQLCNDGTGNAVQLGVRWNPGTHLFDVLEAAGPLFATPGTNTTACNSGGAIPGAIPLSPPLSVPQGHVVKLVIHETAPGIYNVFAKDLTASISSSEGVGAALIFPRTASAGVVQNTIGLSAPASNLLVRFRHTRVLNDDGISGYLGDQGAWTAVRVFDTANGLNSDPPLVNPGALTQGRFPVLIGSEVGP